MMLVIDLEATCDEGDGLLQLTWRSSKLARCGPRLRAPCSTRFRRWCAPCYALSSRRFVGSSPTSSKPTWTVPSCSQWSRHGWPASPNAIRHRAQRGKLGPIRLQAACPRLRATRRQNPLAAFEHVNLKRRFAKARKIKEVGMARALQMVGLPLDGAHHRGLDDARNIAKLLPWSI